MNVLEKELLELKLRIEKLENFNKMLTGKIIDNQLEKEKEKDCENCKYNKLTIYQLPCSYCDDYNNWEVHE